jgi:hypothetical protein
MYEISVRAFVSKFKPIQPFVFLFVGDHKNDDMTKVTFKWLTIVK